MTSRRSFLSGSGGLLTGAWIASHWSSIARAHEHAEGVAAAPMSTGFDFLSAAEAADVDAIAAQIVPSGATPGAREAHAVYFIDRALATFFAAWAHECRSGLATFQSQFRALEPAAATFAAASSQRQIAFLRTVEGSEFFGQMRFLTLLGMFASPKYGGNHEGIGWKLIGFQDQHIFTPPFGYYDREYTGFVPYTQKST
jgi:gluconate 2-dehydrogenase gamma chain